MLKCNIMYRVLDFAVTFALRLWTSFPPIVVHNLSKSRIIQMLFYQQNIEGVEGDYIEFGVASGIAKNW